jgi:uncharacterized protein (TIGR00369 family)
MKVASSAGELPGEDVGESERQIAFSDRNGHAHCLLCGGRNPESWGLSFAPGKDGSVHATLAPHAGLQGYDGILHGGVTCALLDAAMTHCLFHQGVQAVTADLHVRFVRPVSAAEGVGLRAWIVATRPPLYRLGSEILQGGRVAARGEATFLMRRRSRRTRHATEREADERARNSGR